MENLELYNLKDTEVRALDFEGMKTYLENVLVSYRNNVYTKENLAAAKEDKAELNKVKKMIEDNTAIFKLIQHAEPVLCTLILTNLNR